MLVLRDISFRLAVIGAAAVLAVLAFTLFSTQPQRRLTAAVEYTSGEPCYGTPIFADYPYERQRMPPFECEFQCDIANDPYYIVYSNIDNNTSKLYGTMCSKDPALGFNPPEYGDCRDYGEDFFIPCATVFAAPVLSSSSSSISNNCENDPGVETEERKAEYIAYHVGKPCKNDYDCGFTHCYSDLSAENDSTNNPARECLLSLACQSGICLPELVTTTRPCRGCLCSMTPPTACLLTGACSSSSFPRSSSSSVPGTSSSSRSSSSRKSSSSSKSSSSVRSSSSSSVRSSSSSSFKRCGDGHVDAGEECDYGGRCIRPGAAETAWTNEASAQACRASGGVTQAASNDGCSATCKWETCGDGILQPNGLDGSISTVADNEQCDNGKKCSQTNMSCQYEADCRYSFGTCSYYDWSTNTMRCLGNISRTCQVDADCVENLGCSYVQDGICSTNCKLIGGSGQSSSRSSTSSSVGPACTGTECAIGGNAICGALGFTCNTVSTSPCFECRVGSSSSRPPVLCQGNECNIGGGMICSLQNKQCRTIASSPCIECFVSAQSSSSSVRSSSSSSSSSVVGGLCTGMECSFGGVAYCGLSGKQCRTTSQTPCIECVSGSATSTPAINEWWCCEYGGSQPANRCLRRQPETCEGTVFFTNENLCTDKCIDVLKVVIPLLNP